MLRTVCTWVLASSALMPLWTARAQPTFEPPTIASIQAFPFDQYTGRVSDTDVLSETFRGGWNDTKSDGLLIIVELHGLSSRVYDGSLGPGSKYSVRLSVNELGSGKRLLQRSRVLGVMGGDGRLFVSYFVEPSFCHVIRVVASIVGRGAAPPVERRASFACGE